VAGVAVAARAQARAPSPVLDAMRTELARSLTTFKGQPTAPYFLSYEITEDHTVDVAGSFGAITQRSERRHRALNVHLRVPQVDSRWYVNSEGSEIQTSQPIYRLYVSAFSKADDGMELPRYESFWSFTPEGLPSDRTVLAAVQQMIDDLHALRRAPALEPYTGPAILSGRASAVFFHEVFGHRVEGHRQKLGLEGQTFKKK